jgi:hypothetical protein
MGDRSNVVIQDSEGGRVYLYAHWLGDGILKSAIKGLESGRVDDPAYLARVIFTDMVKNDLDGETGFGISTYFSDNDGYPILVLSEDGSAWFENESKTKLTEAISSAEMLKALKENDTFAKVSAHFGI